MRHLTVDEILDFVSLTELSRESVAFAAAVNGHTRKCEKCRKTVCAIQAIYDKFVEYSAEGSFKDFVLENVSAMKEKTINEPEELDASR